MMMKSLIQTSRTGSIGPALLAISAMLLLGFSVPPAGAEEGKPSALRVCADPNNLPFSNRHEQGFENRIAELFAAKLDVPLEYTWYPQRWGFEKNTLRKWLEEENRYSCDLIIGVSPEFEMGVATDPYFTSQYVLVMRDDKAPESVRTANDILRLPADRQNRLKIGVFVPGPGVDWLLRNGLMDTAEAYRIQDGDPDHYPGMVLEGDLRRGDIDGAIIWGPIAGYFMKRNPDTEVKVLPMSSEPGLRFEYSIAMGVRYGEKEWKQTVESLIDEHQDDIEAILEDYNVPLVEQPSVQGVARRK